MSHPYLKNESRNLLKTMAENDEIKKLKYITENHDHENVLKSPKIDNDYY